MRSITLNICHLYPNLMDTYGDRGNITTIIKRCRWREIDIRVSNISINQSLPTYDFDFYFFGGGQDRQQLIVGKDLKTKAKKLQKAIDQSAVLLSVCGGYQLLQKYFKTQEGQIIEGIHLFDAFTVGSKKRMIQNLLIEINPKLQPEIVAVYPSTMNLPCRQAGDRLPTNLIGFENHSGQTYLSKNTQALGKVMLGAGNNGEDQTEGVIYKNAFGCYLHGSLLPKNPHFADYLISKALERRYGIVKLKPLDDSLEWQAHKSAVNRAQQSP